MNIINQLDPEVVYTAGADLGGVHRVHVQPPLEPEFKYSFVIKSRDITERDRKQKFRPNQNVLYVTSRRGGRCVLPRIAVIAN